VDPNVVLPLLSSAASFVFAGLVFAQWLQRRRSFQLVWTIGLLWYGISAGTELIGSAFGWSEPLYRTWYLIGAFFVAAYLGMGTVYLLAKTRFGYFVAVTLLLGGLFGLSIRGRYPDAGELGLTVILFSLLAAAVVALTTWLRRDWSGHATMAVLALGSVGVTYLVLTAQIAAPGWSVDPVTHVPIGEAMPGAVRVLAAPFNIAGALALVFGALFSAYVFMPKRKILRGRGLPPVVAQVYGGVAVAVNFLASIPLAIGAARRGELHSRVPATLLIAIGGFIPGVTSGLNRFGFTWAFFLGELVGVLFIFAGFLVSTEVFASRARSASPALGREVSSA
jgi:hypothetical protein